MSCEIVESPNRAGWGEEGTAAVWRPAVGKVLGFRAESGQFSPEGSGRSPGIGYPIPHSTTAFLSR